MHYLYLKDEQGHFDLIDGDFLHLYSKDIQENLIKLTDEQYACFCQKGSESTQFLNGEFVFEEITVDLTALFTQRQTELLQRIADKTDQLKAKYLQGYSQAEIDSFYRQEREARGELPLLLLAELFEGRDDLTDIDQLKAKVIEKADLFAMVMGATFAKKQHFEKALEQAETLEALDHIRQEIDKWKT